MGKKSFYGVRVGRVPGVYADWGACLAQTAGYSGAVFRGFRSREEAEAWVQSSTTSLFAKSQELSSGVGIEAERCGRQPVDEEPEKRRRVSDIGQGCKSHSEVGESSHESSPPLSKGGTGCHSVVSLPLRRERQPWRLWFDGSCRGNPGPGGGGAVIQNDKGEVVYEISSYFGFVTNNVAEYRALICGMRTAVNLGVEHLHCCGDSQLVCCQVNGEYRVGPEMAPYHREVILLSRFLGSFSLHWIPRYENGAADSLAARGALSDGGFGNEGFETEFPVGGAYAG